MMLNANGHIVLVTQFQPDPSGHGGNHRAYQIYHDLLGCVRPESITLINFDSPEGLQQVWQKKKKPTPPVSRLNILIKERLPYLRAAHPIEKLMNKWFMFDHFSQPEFSRHYAGQAAKLPRPLICIMENAAFGPAILPFNKKHKIPTLICPQNIESWDRLLPFTADDPRRKYLACLNFADEWRIIEQCDASLFISKVEHALFRSLGVKANYYPYIPVGAIDEYWSKIRQTRRTTPPQRNLFLLLGSCSHGATHHAFTRLLEQIAQHIPPEGFQIKIAGSQTEKLDIPPTLRHQVSIMGRISQDQLSSELARVTAQLVPHDLGFGSLTRLSELSCGGVPVLASTSASASLNPPPGIEWVDPEVPHAWSDAIRRAIHSPPLVPTRDLYLQWVQAQPSPFPGLLCPLLAPLTRPS